MRVPPANMIGPPCAATAWRGCTQVYQRNLGKYQEATPADRWRRCEGPTKSVLVAYLTPPFSVLEVVMRTQGFLPRTGCRAFTRFRYCIYCAAQAAG